MQETELSVSIKTELALVKDKLSKLQATMKLSKDLDKTINTFKKLRLLTEKKAEDKKIAAAKAREQAQKAKQKAAKEAGKLGKKSTKKNNNGKIANVVTSITSATNLSPDNKSAESTATAKEKEAEAI